MKIINLEDFKQIDMKIGTVITAEEFKEAKNPAIKLKIDFGELGVKQSSAQITDYYFPEDLIGTQVTAIVNFPAMRIAGYKSEVLVLGAVPSDEKVVLLKPDRKVPNGTKIS